MYKKINTNFNIRNLPPNYMEQFCRALHPDLEISPTCLSWFRQATDHCTDLIMRKDSGSRFWATVKNFIFPDRNTGLVSQKIPISVHPNRLSVHDCQSLFLDIVRDYILRAPRYSTESAMNVLLWQILYSLMGIMALLSLLVTTIFAYRKFGRSLKVPNDLELVYAPEKRARAYLNHNMRVMRYELQRLHVCHVVQPEELFPPDGTTTLVMKMSSKLNFLDGIVSSTATCTGRLYRMYEMMGKKKPEYKVETLPKVMRFVNSSARKLRVLFVFDEDPVYEELLRRRKAKSPPKLSPPKRSPPKLSPPKYAPQSQFMSSTPLPPPTPAALTMLKSSSHLSTRGSSTPPRSLSPTSKVPKQPTLIPRNFTRRHSALNLKRPAKKDASGGDT